MVLLLRKNADKRGPDQMCRTTIAKPLEHGPFPLSHFSCFSISVSISSLARGPPPFVHFCHSPPPIYLSRPLSSLLSSSVSFDVEFYQPSQKLQLPKRLVRRKCVLCHVVQPQQGIVKFHACSTCLCTDVKSGEWSAYAFVQAVNSSSNRKVPRLT